MIGRGDRKGRKWSESGGRDWQKRRPGMTVGGGEGKGVGKRKWELLRVRGMGVDGTGMGTVRKDRKRDFAGDGKGDEEGKRGTGTAEKIRKKRVGEWRQVEGREEEIEEIGKLMREAWGREESGLGKKSSE